MSSLYWRRLITPCASYPSDAGRHNVRRSRRKCYRSLTAVTALCASHHANFQTGGPSRSSRRRPPRAGRRADARLSGHPWRLVQSELALRWRRGRLSAALVRPAARRRARRRCTIARRSASPAAGQAAISSSVRMQPVHRPEPGSSRHTPMQGEGISLTRRSSLRGGMARRPVAEIEHKGSPRKRRHRPP
jgi:hypothetical protein